MGNAKSLKRSRSITSHVALGILLLWHSPAMATFLCHRAVGQLVDRADERLSQVVAERSPIIPHPYPKAWFNNLHPRSLVSGVVAQLTRGLGENGIHAALPANGAAYYHGFVDVSRYDRPLSQEDILKIMTTTGHASRLLVTEAKRKFGRSFLDVTSAERQDLVNIVTLDHYDRLSRSQFGPIKAYLFSADPSDNYSSPYLSGSTNRGVCAPFCSVMPSEKGGSGFLMKVRPSIASIKIERLEKRASRPARNYWTIPADAVSLTKPIYRFRAANSEAGTEVIDLVYLPEQIEAVIRIGSAGEVLQAFYRYDTDSSLLIVVKDYEQHLVNVIEMVAPAKRSSPAEY